jgi:glycosyltransferase involved in cell wall biosynthesis
VRELVRRGIPETTRFIIVGDGEWKDCLKELAVSLGISDRVRFTGYVPPGELPALISRMNIFVISSAVESLPYTLIEAMTCGVPVISTAVGGIPEIITDGYNGILVQPGDHYALAEKILLLMASPEICSRMVSNAGDGRLDRFSIGSTVHQLEHLYEDECRRNKRSG